MAEAEAEFPGPRELTREEEALEVLTCQCGKPAEYFRCNHGPHKNK